MKTLLGLAAAAATAVVSVAADAAANTAEAAANDCEHFLCGFCADSACAPLLGVVGLVFGTLLLSKLYVDYTAGVAPLEGAGSSSSAAAASAASGAASRSSGSGSAADSTSPAASRTRSRSRSRARSTERPSGKPLTEVSGIGPDTAKRLESIGVSSVEALASLNAAQAETLYERLKSTASGARSPGPKTLQKWIEAAKEMK